MLLYPLAYAIVWSLPTGIRIYQTVTGQPAPWQLQTVDKACIVLQGFVDAVIYGATESSLSNWRNLFFPRRFPAAIGGVGPGLGYGDLSGKRSSNRWSSAPPRSGDQQLVSRPSTEMGGPPPHASPNSAGSSTIGESVAGASTEQIELGSLDRNGKGSVPMMGIRKTVEIDVVSSAPGHEGQAVPPQKPLKAYFPDDGGPRLEGTFLDM